MLLRLKASIYSPMEDNEAHRSSRMMRDRSVHLTYIATLQFRLPTIRRTYPTLFSALYKDA